MPVETDADRLAVDQRRHRVGVLFVQRKNMVEISKMLDVSVLTVRHDLDVIRSEWIGAATADIIAKRAEELALLDVAIAEAWAGWYRSLEPRTVTKAVKTGPGGQPVTSAVTYKRDGDPRFLALIAKYIDQRARLLGLNLQPDDPVPQNNNSNVVIVLPENYRGGAKQIKSEVTDGVDVEQPSPAAVPGIDG